MHYKRWRRHGDPEVKNKPGKPRGFRGTIQERLNRKISVQLDGCWYWTGAANELGYGTMLLTDSNGKRRNAKAHRVSYELAHGKILEGLELDHLCRAPRCVNPEHLEPVTHLVNMQRAYQKGG